MFTPESANSTSSTVPGGSQPHCWEKLAKEGFASSSDSVTIVNFGSGAAARGGLVSALLTRTLHGFHYTPEELAFRWMSAARCIPEKLAAGRLSLPKSKIGKNHVPRKHHQLLGRKFLSNRGWYGRPAARFEFGGTTWGPVEEANIFDEESAASWCSRHYSIRL